MFLISMNSDDTIVGTIVPTTEGCLPTFGIWIPQFTSNIKRVSRDNLDTCRRGNIGRLNFYL